MLEILNDIAWSHMQDVINTPAYVDCEVRDATYAATKLDYAMNALCIAWATQNAQIRHGGDTPGGENARL